MENITVIEYNENDTRHYGHKLDLWLYHEAWMRAGFWFGDESRKALAEAYARLGLGLRWSLPDVNLTLTPTGVA